MKRPDITPAQVVALVQAVIAILVSFSLSITEAQSAALLALTTIIAAVLITGDAAIRRGRARVEEARVTKELELKKTEVALTRADREKEELLSIEAEMKI